jgi:hypothetical protein
MQVISNRHASLILLPGKLVRRCSNGCTLSRSATAGTVLSRVEALAAGTRENLDLEFSIEGEQIFDKTRKILFKATWLKLAFLHRSASVQRRIRSVVLDHGAVRERKV